MSVEKVLSISGKPGLYELKIQTRSGFIAESLVDGKKLTVGLKSNVSLLSEISIYTQTGEIKLFEVFASIAKKENKGEAISHKSDNSTLENYFAEIVPDYDTERVYASDIKKVLNWYNILHKAGFIEQFNAVVEEPVAEEKPKAKKAAEPKAEGEEKPKAKKAAPKAKAEGEEKPKAKKAKKEE